MKRFGLVLLILVCLCSIASAATLTLPAAVKEIEEEAFYGDSSLDEVVLPEGIEKIGARAFAGSSIRRIFLPASLSEISEDAFDSCADVIGYGPSGSFAYHYFTTKSNLSFDALDLFIFNDIDENTCEIVYYNGWDGTVRIPRYSPSGKRIVRIASNAFGWKNFQEIILPDTITEIREQAFAGSFMLRSVTLPSSLSVLHERAFLYCDQLLSIEVDPANENFSSRDGILYDKAGTTMIKYPPALDGELFISSPITRIGNNAFYGCGNNLVITFDDSVIEIAGNAFENCNAVIYAHKDTDVAKQISRAGGFFRDDDRFSLKYLFDGNEVTGCMLSDVDKDIEGVFVVPSYITAINSYAFQNCTKITDVVMHDGINSIGNGAFSGCTSLRRVNLPNQLTSVSGSLFSGCTSLVDMSIPESVTSIGVSAFYGCSALATIDIPATVISIGSGAFNGCNALTDLELATVPTSMSSDLLAVMKFNFAGHTYEFVRATVSWKEAKSICERMGGHLVTITSQSEQDFLQSVLNSTGSNYTDGYWIGATDEATEGKWEWITGEAWTYSNWALRQPDNYYGNQDYGRIAAAKETSPNWVMYSGEWDDEQDFTCGYICEWSPDLTIPTPTNPLDNVVSWNNHRYVVFDEYKTWSDARDYCESLGGHLATITTAEEQAFIGSLLDNYSRNNYFLGGTDVDVEGKWKWITGEEWSYSNWGTGSPDNHAGNEDYLTIFNVEQKGTEKHSWNDHCITGVYPGDASYLFRYDYQVGFICEWDDEQLPPMEIVSVDYVSLDSYTYRISVNVQANEPVDSPYVVINASDKLDVLGEFDESHNMYLDSSGAYGVVLTDLNQKTGTSTASFVITARSVVGEEIITAVVYSKNEAYDSFSCPVTLEYDDTNDIANYYQLCIYSKYEKLIEDRMIYNAIVKGLMNDGISRTNAINIADFLRSAPALYSNLYVWSFYDYDRVLDSSVQAAVFYFGNYGERGKILIDDASVAEVWFHESGHAIDYSCINKHFTLSDKNKETLYELLREGVRKIIYEQVKKASGASESKLTESEINTMTDAIVGSDNAWFPDVENKKWNYGIQNIQSVKYYDIPVPENLADYEEIWTQSLRNVAEFIDFYDDLNLSFLQSIYNGYIGSFMLGDMVSGFTNNTVNSLSGHAGPFYVDNQAYWYSSSGIPTYKQVTEAWAEYFSSAITGTAYNYNKQFFSKACKEMDEIAKELLQMYIDKHTN